MARQVPDDRWRGMMIDLETLDTAPTAVTLSAGIVIFTKTSVLEENYYEFDSYAQLDAGRSVSLETIEWWNKTNPEELKRLRAEGKDRVRDFTMYLFEAWRSYKCTSVWSRGTLDIAIIEDIIRPPWNFWEQRDVRTFDEFGEFSPNSHNALEDCMAQIEHVQKYIPKQEK